MRIDVNLEHRAVEDELAALHARMRHAGDALHALREIPSPLPGFAFHYRESDGEFFVYVEDVARDVLAGCTVFNRLVDIDRSAGRFLRSPHSRYAPAYTRRGLASAVYGWALDAGMCLVSGPRQSPAAYALWMSLARSHPLVFVDTSGKLPRIIGTPVQQSELEALDTRMLLLGAGWTPERLTGS